MGARLKASLQGQDVSAIQREHMIFVGMSGVGKSKWSKAISDGSLGYQAYEIDDQIGRNPRMQSFLRDYEGSDEVEKMGKAFGKPWEDPVRYQEQERTYLMAEREEMKRLLGVLKSDGQRYVADLTGSAIYCPDEMQALEPHGLVIYLRAGLKQYDAMRENFLADPKPVCWGEVLEDWKRVVRETDPRKKLPELYTALLESRNRLYTATADVILPWEAHRERARLNNPKSLFEEVHVQLNAEA